MSEEHERVGELLAYGLDPRLAPGRDARYAELVARFRSEPVFREAVENVAKGQGLTILDCSPVYGLVLTSAGPESPYHMRLDDYAAMTPEERHLNAFTFLAIATACYPTAEALDADDGPLPSVTVQQVIRLMNRMSEKIRERAGESDPPIEEPQLEPLYRLVLRWREGDTTGDERSNPHVKTGMVRRALKWLVANGLADEVSTARDTYRMRSRFRLHVKDATTVLAGALARVRELASATER